MSDTTGRPAGSTGHIRYEVDESGVATITIDRPAKRNAMTYAVLRDFLDTVAMAGADDTARVVIVTGAGGAFCAGTDLSDLSDTPSDRRGAMPASDRSRGHSSPVRSR
ncbi:MAG: enoyl-CoA hydratase/isomerase family protein [Ilumatobacteraceae bacterium]